MSRIEEVSATIGIQEFCEEYRNVEYFFKFCQECNGFGKTWACPPFEQPIEIEQFEYAHIFGKKIWVDSHKCSTKFSSEELREEISQILNPVRVELDKMLLELERLSPNSRALFAGSCKGCPEGQCTRPSGKPCIKPHMMRPSLESLGFDVSKTTSQLLGIELKWCQDQLPEYFTLVYALFTKDPIIY